MFLDITDLIKKKTDEKEFSLEINRDMLKRDDFEVKLISPLIVKGKATLDGEDIIVKGSIETSIKSFCARCLKSVDYPLNINFEERFSKKQGEDIYPMLEDRIDLEDMIVDNVILSYPLKVLCKEDCKGLCPECGLDLNEGQCDCLKDVIDPRLEALKSFFKGE